MFKKIVFWVEFPREIDWEKVEELLKKVDLDIDIYVASETRKEFLALKEKIKKYKYIKEIGVWPVLSKEEGYWFSGQISKESIDKLKDFKGLKVKIDLEAPFKGKYNNLKLIGYGFFKVFRKGENMDYLNKVIKELSESSEVEIIVNEFPLPRFLLKRSGLYINIDNFKSISKNIMGYTTIAGRLFRPFLRVYKSIFAKIAFRKYKDKLICSIGLIGPGILEDEGFYKNVREFEQDLKSVEKVGIKKIAVYSLERLMQRENPEEWIRAVCKFKE